MVNVPKEQDAAVREGSGHDAKAPVKKIEVQQDLAPGQILVRCSVCGSIVVPGTD